MAYTDIDKPDEYFNTKLYTGTGATQSITGLNFAPDWVWLKQRNTTRSHWLFDIVRGATLRLHSESTDAEATEATTLTSFNSDGFSLGSSIAVNQSAGTYVAWNWLAGGTASSNTDGSITSNVSASTTSGFSIVSYTGDGSSSSTVGHDLGVAPSVVIIKRRNASDTWYVMHTSLSSNNNVFLNLTDAQQNVSTYTGGLISTSPTSSVFSFVNGTTVNNVNASGGTYIAYCFAEKTGFNKFGSYTGNGNADGTFIYTGFKPAFVMVKRTDSTGNWVMVDSKRDTFNVCDALVSADISDAEYDIDAEDFLSNGFKMRDNHSTRNASGGTYIYMAFAENPFVSSTGVPACAR